MSDTKLTTVLLKENWTLTDALDVAKAEIERLERAVDDANEQPTHDRHVISRLKLLMIKHLTEIERLTADLADAKAEISRLRGLLIATARGETSFVPGFRAEPGPRSCRVCGLAMQAVLDGDRHGWCR